MIKDILLKDWKATWTIRRYFDSDSFEERYDGLILPKPDDISIVEGNVALNEGLQAVADLLAGIASPTLWDNVNANLGVGNGTAVEDATHTGLQGASTAFQGMEASYPQRFAQTLTWRAVFGSGVAEFAWEEFTVVNAVDDTGDNLNRKVSSQGTKSAGQTWTLDLDIALS